jgi:hypothetical protein
MIMALYYPNQAMRGVGKKYLKGLWMFIKSTLTLCPVFGGNFTATHKVQLKEIFLKACPRYTFCRGPSVKAVKPFPTLLIIRIIVRLKWHKAGNGRN